ncbi:MAG: hypothetical protein HQK83_05820 [Fibrobacteria bacterium]|nr:hypothetical protein [Fibrobacteria bacterium]
MKKASKKNCERIKDNTHIKKWTPDSTLFFEDGMLFLESLDIAAYYEAINEGFKNTLENRLFEFKKKKDENIKKTPETLRVDKTEFDCVILCKNQQGEEELLVIEVKCYTDLDEEEIERQQVILKTLVDEKCIAQYHHFTLISYSNVINPKSNSIWAKERFKELDNDLHIVTWDDFAEYLCDDRMPIQCLHLSKHIHIKDLKPGTHRDLIRAENDTSKGTKCH